MAEAEALPRAQTGQLREQMNRVVAWLALLSLAFLSLLPAFAWVYPLELLSHFHFQVVLVTLVLPLAFLQLKMPRALLLSGLLAGWNLVGIVPWYLPHRPAAKGPGLKIMLSNVLFYNSESARLNDLLKQQGPDIVILQEQHIRHLALMEQWRKQYPYFLKSGKGAGEMGIWSRIPFGQAKQLFLGPAEFPSFLIQLKWQGRKIDLLATHPAAPVNQTAFERRNAELEEIGKLMASSEAERILIGDLNITPWSPYYRELIRQTGLYNARKGFGLKPTWPTELPGLVRIPLDHVLLSPGLRVLSLETGPELGSDHLPLLVSLTLS